MLTIVDYGLGNLGSIQNMLRKLGHPVEVVDDPERIDGASKLILPGVGAFDRGMDHLTERGLVGPLSKRVIADGVPILGICLGAQLMTRESEEGQRPGLGWLEARTVRFFSREPHDLKVPYMGWNDVEPTRPHPRFYFVHSFHFECERADDVLATSTYGYRFASAFAFRNILGVQFHPEKSHKFGMKLLDNFARVRSPVLSGVAGGDR
jgi:glutamine amidotransferase